jgi:regulator of ribonuclease activity A
MSDVAVAWTTPDLADAHPEQVVALELQMQSYGRRPQFYGPVVTVKCFEDNSRVKELVNTPGAGRVLVVDGGGSLRRALLGDLLAGAAVSNGWSGLIINGAIRDVSVINQLDIGVKALGVVPLKTNRNGEGQAHLPVAFGNVRFTGQHFIYADANGVLVSTQALL